MNRLTAASIPPPTFSARSGHNCSSVTRNPSRLVAMIGTVDECADDRFDLVGGSVEDVLAVVEHQQPDLPFSAAATISQHGLYPVAGSCLASPPSRRAPPRIGAAPARKPEPIEKVSAISRRDFGRQSDLADSPDPSQRDQPMLMQSPLGDLGDPPLAADETSRRAPTGRQRLVSSARNGGKSVPRPGAPQLKEPVPASARHDILVPDRTVRHRWEQTRCRARHQDLPSVSGGHHPRGTVGARCRRSRRPGVRLRRLRYPFAPATGAPAAHRSPHRRRTAARRTRRATPSPVWLEHHSRRAPRSPIRSTSSCVSRDARIASALASHRRVEPSTSVNKNVTTPDGGNDPPLNAIAPS